MRRTIVFASALLALNAAGATAASGGEPGYYITGDAGASFLPDLHLKDPALGTQHEHFDTGFAAGGAFGYDTGDGIRMELASLYQGSSLTSLAGAPATGHLSSTSLMANATYDIWRGAPITPYVGAGLGVQNVGGEVNSLRGRAWKPAYQAEAGLRDDLTDQVSLFGEYRFSQSESVTMSDPTDSAHQHFADHALLAGLSYKITE
jgi:opacity protein-like surface antigen